jgi:tetratricopeptide (TPR) repeat protein
VRDHLQPTPSGDYAPVEATFGVPTHSGQTTVHIKYPGGVLAKETHPVQMTDWPSLDEDAAEADDLPFFDRRMMEGMMAQFGGGFKDSKLNQAQQLMYQAWEERNPARRIILAHEALTISPHCTDAYVLLAEEEADTLARALEYYQKGVTAAEKALGKKYFKENEGHFWGLLETRPYMRARQGLANTLWELGRKEEALGHFRDMLRLNPGDNQGIRYTLLNLLLTLNRETEAQALLDEYDDGMAEWLYTRALLAFRHGGAGPRANSALQEALQTNAHVPAYLTGRQRIPVKLPSYVTWGGDDEAVHYASSYLPYWRRTPGAIEWLQTFVLAKAKPPKNKKNSWKSRQPKR